MENKAIAAEQESKEKVQASIEKSKDDAKARQDAFKAQVKAKEAESAQHWEDLQAGYNRKVLEIKTKIDTGKGALEAKRARLRADVLGPLRRMRSLCHSGGRRC